MKQNKRAWYALCKAINEEVLANITGKLQEELTGIPYVPKNTIVFPKIEYFEFQVLESFTYKHTHQDVNNGTYTFTKGEIITLREMNGEWFLPDRSKLKYIRTFKK